MFSRPEHMFPKVVRPVLAGLGLLCFLSGFFVFAGTGLYALTAPALLLSEQETHPPVLARTAEVFEKQEL